MKKVRVFVSAAALLLSITLLAGHQEIWIAAAKRTHPHHHLNRDYRAHASLAIDTYGSFDIRVWVDGVLINRRPSTYVEIPSLRAGYRFVEIEVLGHRGSHFISNEMFLEPHRWNLYEIQRHPNRNWFACNVLYTRPIGFHYVGGRRASVNFNYNNINWRPSYEVGISRNIRRNQPTSSQAEPSGREDRDIQQGGRESQRGVVYTPRNHEEQPHPRGRGTRSGG